MTSPLRIGVVGATGALGGEVLALLAESSLDVEEVVAVATDRSLGHDIEFRGEVYPVLAEVPKLRGLDLLFVCTPATPALEYAREALRAEVLCVDATGALASSPEVPLRVAGLEAPGTGDDAPLLVAPPGAALPLALVLRPLEEAAGLRRVVGTWLEGASSGGRAGIESLFQESIAIFNQQDLPDPVVFPRPVAFDCIPALGNVGEGGGTDREEAVTAALKRLLRGDGTAPIALTGVQIPVFAGYGATVAVETERPLDPKQAEGVLSGAAGVELWDGEADGATLRAVAGREEVVVGRVRRDPTAEQGLLLWIAADVLRLTAANAVRLAVTRLRLHH